ncbi:hypothetical protein O181_033979 [Austropuccinia psidii MF-1]|uniref:Uncharacterized protein n=1 Tax=Austropuccinia psidii MF-1 TaxID=1389203 RepID=A0A9Q3CZT6_9BASI|nr:hypothetical protein [Austropuccinia psidii MF-1]
MTERIYSTQFVYDQLKDLFDSGSLVPSKSNLDVLEGVVETSFRNTPVNTENEQEINNEIISLSFFFLHSLLPLLEIDSDFFFNPKELPETDELIENKANAVDSVSQAIAFASVLVQALSKYYYVCQHALAQLTLEIRWRLVYRLSRWFSTGYINDEWRLTEATRDKIQQTLGRLWDFPCTIDNKLGPQWDSHLELASMILTNEIKPLFTEDGGSSRKVSSTGRRVQNEQEHLFGPASSAFDESQPWKLEGMGFWNSICDILNRLHHKLGLQEIWPLLIPPIITLLEESTPRYRLRGLQMSISLLEHTPSPIICRTGIDSLLQSFFSTTFSFLNIPQTLDLLNSTFEANLKLIESQWLASQKNRQDQVARYNRYDQLMEESVFNVLAFGKTREKHTNSINDFIIIRMSNMVHMLGYPIGRYLRVILPFLCETLLNLDSNQPSWITIQLANKLIVDLFSTCPDLLVKWKSRIIVVLATVWLNSQTCGNNCETDFNQSLAMLKQSIIDILRYVAANNVEGQRDNTSGDLLEMMKVMKQENSSLKDIFDPILSQKQEIHCDVKKSSGSKAC